MVEVLRAFHERSDFVFENEAQVMAAVSAFEKGGDLADHLIVECARACGCSKLLSFDARLAERHLEFVVRPR